MYSFFTNSIKKGGEGFRGCVVVVNFVSGVNDHETRFTHHKIKETKEEEKR
jgi:hypothetical protein